MPNFKIFSDFCFFAISNLCFDVIATILAIISLIIIAYVFKEKSYKEKPKGYYWLPITFIIAVLVILLGAVVYNPKLESIPIERISFHDCEICFIKQIHAYGKNFCQDSKNEKIKNKFCEYFHAWDENQDFGKILNESFCILNDYENLLKLCCSENAEDYVKKLKDIKTEKIKCVKSYADSNERLKALLEVFLLDEIAIDIFEKSISRCACNKCNKAQDMKCCPNCCVNQSAES